MSIINFLEKGALLGLGAIGATTEKTKKVVDDLIKQGEITKKDGEKLIKDLSKKSEKFEKDLNKKINDNVDKLINKLGFVKKKEMAAMKKKITELEKKLKSKKSG